MSSLTCVGCSRPGTSHSKFRFRQKPYGIFFLRTNFFPPPHLISAKAGRPPLERGQAQKDLNVNEGGAGGGGAAAGEDELRKGGGRSISSVGGKLSECDRGPRYVG